MGYTGVWGGFRLSLLLSVLNLPGPPGGTTVPSMQCGSAQAEGGAVQRLETGGRGFRHCRSLWAACCLFSPTPRQAGKRGSPQVTAPPSLQRTVPVSTKRGDGPLPPSPGDSRGPGMPRPLPVIGRQQPASDT